MTGVSYEIQVDHAEIAKRLRHIAQRASDLDDVLHEFGELLVPSTQQRMVLGVAPDGSPWAPLAPSTLARKKGPGILRESLALMGSIRYQVEGDELRVGTNLVYGAAQQFGLPPHVIRAKPGKALMWPGGEHPVSQVNHPGLKARPYLGLSAEDEEELLAILWDYILGDFITSDSGGGAIA